MDIIVQKNIKFLSAYHPLLKKKLLPMDSLSPYRYAGKPKSNILVGNRSYHSKKYPEREAMSLVEGFSVQKGHLILFFGVGLAYHIELFKKLYPEAVEATLIAVEKSAQAFTILTHRKDLSFLQGVSLFINEDLQRIERFFHSLDPVSFKGYRIVRLRGACSLFPEYYDQIEARFKRVMSLKLSDILTRLAFESLWMKNIVKNVPFLCGKSPINSLKNILLNKTALIIGAGPSLTEQLDLINKLSGSIYLITVDTAIEPLLLRGIRPDFIVTLDGQYFTLSHFQTLLSGRDHGQLPILIADVVCQPLVLKHWRGPIYFSTTTSTQSAEMHPLVHMLSERFQLLHTLPCGGSVATTAIEFALFLGANPVYVTGLDLSFTYFRTHASATSNDQYIHRLSSRLKTVHSLMGDEIHKRNLLFLPGIGGERVLTDFVFGNYIDWFSQKQEYLNRVYNVTERGAEIPPLKHFGLENIKPEKYSGNGKVLFKLKSGEKLSKASCMKFLEDLRKEIPRARMTLFTHPEQKTQVHRLLRDIYPLALSIHRDRVSTDSYVHLFLDLLEKYVLRSIQRMKARDH